MVDYLCYNFDRHVNSEVCKVGGFISILWDVKTNQPKYKIMDSHYCSKRGCCSGRGKIKSIVNTSIKLSYDNVHVGETNTSFSTPQLIIGGDTENWFHSTGEYHSAFDAPINIICSQSFMFRCKNNFGLPVQISGLVSHPFNADNDSLLFIKIISV